MQVLLFSRLHGAPYNSSKVSASLFRVLGALPVAILRAGLKILRKFNFVEVRKIHQIFQNEVSD
jgi:hypothetical protein